MTDTIESELHQIQTRLHVGKDKVNSFGGYNYRTAEGIISAVKPMLPPGAFLTLSDDIREVAGQVFLFATATLTLADGTTHSAQSAALHPLTKKGMDPSQITGSASSYARKYALAGLFAIDDGKEEIDGRRQEYEPEPPKLPDDVAASVAAAETLDALRALWTDNEQYQRIAAFKDAVNKRKNELQPKDQAA